MGRNSTKKIIEPHTVEKPKIKIFNLEGTVEKKSQWNWICKWYTY